MKRPCTQFRVIHDDVQFLFIDQKHKVMHCPLSEAIHYVAPPSTLITAPLVAEEIGLHR